MYGVRRGSVPGKGLAITSMVIGICSVVLFFATFGFLFLLVAPLSVTGLILGTIAKKQLDESDTPSGMAITGIVLSVVGLALSIVCIVICFCPEVCFAFPDSGGGGGGQYF
jgi:hypothetical protein